MHRRARLAAVPVFAGVLLAGCSGAASPTPLSSLAPVSMTPPSPTATAGILPTATAGILPTPAGPLVVGNGSLARGAYESRTMGVVVSFDLDDPGWLGAEDLPGAGFALSREEIPGGITITQYPGEVFAEPCSPDKREPVERSAEGFIAWLARHPHLDAGEPVEVTLGGQPAIQLDVTADVGEACPDSPRIWLWVLPTVGDFHLDEGEAARFIAADVGDITLVGVIETLDPSQQGDLLEAAQPVLDSMTVEP